ncbi:MAG: heavy metal translocating P-type ATPase [Alkalispirochaetaceae bacterium]
MPDCRKKMQETVNAVPGLYCIQFDPINRTLLWRYDPAELPGGTLPRESLNATLAKNLLACDLSRPGGSASRCGSCISQRKSSPPCSLLSRLADEGMVTVYPEGGCRVTRRCEELTNRLDRIDLTSVETAGEPAQATPLGRLRRRLAGLTSRLAALPLESAAVVLTLIALVVARIYEADPAGRSVGSIAYLVAYLTGGFFGLKAGIHSLLQRKIDIDLLMILAALGAAAIGAPFEGALLLFLFSLSNLLQDYAMGKTRSAIQALMKLRAARAEVLRDGEQLLVPVDSVGLGEQFVLRPGDRVPLDGRISEGEGMLDESLVTGESRPLFKSKGDELLAGSINQNGSFTVEVTRRSQDSTISRIIQLVEDAQGRKARTERFLDRFEERYAIFVIALTAALAAVPPLLFGEAVSASLYRAITVMVAASPCALIISTPASVLSAIAAGARRGVLFKGGVHVEGAAAVDAIAFDKTGTLTYGTPELTDILPLTSEVDELELLTLAAAVERQSEHALAKATVKAAEDRGVEVRWESVSFASEAGKGVEATVRGRRIRIGIPAYIDSDRDPSDLLNRLRQERKTVVAVGERGEEGRWRYLGVLAFSDTIRENARQVIDELRSLGVKRIVMLTGDNRETAEAIAREAGVDEVYSQLLPEQKLQAIEELEERYASVAMVGDGVNDAPSLAKASIGIAMGARGTDVALETADIVLMADDLAGIPFALGLSRRTRKTLVANLTIALSLILLMIGGIMLYELPLPAAVIGHEGGTVLVSLNGLRLLFYGSRRQASQRPKTSIR